MQVQSSKRPSDQSIRAISSAAAAWTFKLRLFCGSAAPRLSRWPPKNEIDVSSPCHQIAIITASFVGAARQTPKSLLSAQTIQGSGAPLADVGLLAVLGFTLSLPS